MRGGGRARQRPRPGDTNVAFTIQAVSKLARDVSTRLRRANDQIRVLE